MPDSTEYDEPTEHTCGRFAVGYKGQRYEVSYLDANGNEHIMGWTNDASGGSLVRSIEAHPVWHTPRVYEA